MPVHSTGGTPSVPPASTERARPNNANAANTVVATERLLPWSAFTFASASWREVMAYFFFVLVCLVLIQFLNLPGPAVCAIYISVYVFQLLVRNIIPPGVIKILEGKPWY